VTDYTDIVSRLRSDLDYGDLSVAVEEAADAIVALVAENAALKREAHIWSKAAEHYAKPRQPPSPEQVDAIVALGAERDAQAARIAELGADAARYLWLRSLLWTQELNPYSRDRQWLWSTRFLSSVDSSGDLDEVTQAQELDAAIDAARAALAPKERGND
jgi:hypothetical protein